MKKKLSPLKKLRLSTGLNQQAFYGRIRLSQSVGSRYENGRRIAPSVQILLDLAYGNEKKKAAAMKRLGLFANAVPLPVNLDTAT